MVVKQTCGKVNIEKKHKKRITSQTKRFECEQESHHVEKTIARLQSFRITTVVNLKFSGYFKSCIAI